MIWINVDWDNREVMKDAHHTEHQAWRAAVAKANETNRNPYEWDQVAINVED